MATRRRVNPKANRKKLIRALLIVIILLVAIAFVSYLVNKDKPATSETILINEVMAGNKQAVTDEEGNYSDWIELYNPGTTDVSLSGWGLSDSKLEQAKWTFPDISIPAGGYVIVYCDKQDKRETDQPLHANFGLSSSGEDVVLTNNLGVIVDYTTFSQMPSDTSMGRDPKDNSQWTSFEKVTPGYANTDEGYEQFLASRKVDSSPLRISEVMSANVTTLTDDYGAYSDYVEIENTSDSEIDLSGYGLSNKPNKTMKWRFPEGVKIPAHGYVVVYCSGKAYSKDGSNNYLHTNFRLSSYKVEVSLANKAGQILDSVEVPEMKSDTVYLRDPSDNYEWTTSANPSPGYANTAEGFQKFVEANGKPTSSVIISEAMPYNDKYAPTGGAYYDWVEVYNNGSEAVSLKGWGLTDDTEKPLKWKFPDITLAPGQYTLVYCSGLTNLGNMHTNFRISGAGEVIGLFNSSEELVDRVYVSDVPTNMSVGRQSGSDGFFYFQTTTPSTTNSGGAIGFAVKPTITTEAGSYRGAQQVAMEAGDADTTIHYTTDGSIPTESSPVYTGPITVEKTTAVRARAFKEGLLGSKTDSKTFLIDIPHTLPVVSLITDPPNLFDHDYGIYVVGNGQKVGDIEYKNANFQKDWEREVHFEYFDESGKQGVSLDAGIRIFGAFSRFKDQKGFSIRARERYGSDTIDYPFFDTRPYTSYKSITLRAGAQDCTQSKIRDIVVTDLVRETTTLDVAAYKQSVVYINGQYWGIYNIREKINKYMLAQHHNLSNPENIDLIVGDATALVGSTDNYKQMINYVTSNEANINDPEVYKTITDWVDVENFADWCIAEIWSNNTDLGNIKYWREKTPDGKWRWILYDFCWGMYNPEQDAMARLTNPEGMGVGNGISTVLLRTLLKNNEFKELFLTRFAYHMENTFATDRVLAKIDECAGMIEDEIGRDRERWDNGTAESWRNSQIAKMENFAKVRNEYCLYHVKQYFGLSDDEMMRRFGSVGTQPPSTGS